jgi:hypothetical protein
MFSKAEGEAKSFAFDKVFQSSSSQGEVYEEISQLVQSAMDGYKVQHCFSCHTSHVSYNALFRSPFLPTDKLAAAKHTPCLAVSATTCRAKA